MVRVGRAERWAAAGDTHPVCSFFFFFLERINVVSNIYLWVVFTLLSVYSLAMVTLIVKKVNQENLKKQQLCFEFVSILKMFVFVQYGCRKIHQINKVCADFQLLLNFKDFL